MDELTPEVVTTTVSQLSETGTMGVIFTLLIFLGGAFYLLYKFATNHVEHANAAFKDVADSNSEIARSNVEIGKAMTGLKDIIDFKIK